MSDDEITIISRRVKVLEEWKSEQQTEQRLSELRNQHLDQRLDAMNGKIDTINANISKVGWLVVSAIIVALISFIVKGGLNVT